ncbi:MAG: accessory factor UbiK family protein [Alphaproteobacteria bacterium]
MQTRNRLLDDLARVATSALGVAAGMREEIEARLRDQFERVLSGMDLVSREEFDAVKAMAAKARAEQEDLAARMAARRSVPNKAPPRRPEPDPRVIHSLPAGFPGQDSCAGKTNWARYIL